ncbi:hypothetical protein T484DRAFT_1833408 [Baffinella frigidus]|nr:hypothetical protein T484DRAFT_1833408 [Cryptophyta sp. CCMP2293]
MAFLQNKFRKDKKLIVGSAIFGLGWGAGGICPGPGIVSITGVGAGHGSVVVIGAWLITFFLGQYLRFVAA